jgi:hypothetical protein
MEDNTIGNPDILQNIHVMGDEDDDHDEEKKTIGQIAWYPWDFLR